MARYPGVRTMVVWPYEINERHVLCCILRSSDKCMLDSNFTCDSVSSRLFQAMIVESGFEASRALFGVSIVAVGFLLQKIAEAFLLERGGDGAFRY
jgi:hypothetical protein